jgi:hypothetical protein
MAVKNGFRRTHTLVFGEAQGEGLADDAEWIANGVCR